MTVDATALAACVTLLSLAIAHNADRLPQLAQYVVRWAARRLPDPQASIRYEEEWVANVAAVPGKLAPLMSALGYLVAMPRMWRALRSVRPPAQLDGRPIHPDVLMRRARVAVIGVGGIGSTAALSLALSGVGELHLVDSEVVEISNLDRHVLFTEQDVGRSKVAAVVAQLCSRNADIKITGEALTVTGPAVLVQLAARFDIVVLAIDQPNIRSWANRACMQTGTAWIHIGYHGPQVNVGVYRPGSGLCYDCARAEGRERPAAFPVETPEPAQPKSAPLGRGAVSAGIAGNLASHAAMSLITGSPQLQPNSEYRFNLVTLNGNVVVSSPVSRQECPTCGKSWLRKLLARIEKWLF